MVGSSLRPRLGLRTVVVRGSRLTENVVPRGELTWLLVRGLRVGAVLRLMTVNSLRSGRVFLVSVLLER